MRKRGKRDGSTSDEESKADVVGGLAAAVLIFGVWIFIGFTQALRFGLADDGTLKSEAPAFWVNVAELAPLAAAAFWAMRYFHDVPRKRLDVLLASLAATLWVIAMLILSQY